MRKTRIATILITLAILALIVTRFFAPVAPLQWRWSLMASKLSGKLPEIPLQALIRWMRPGSAVDLRGLVNNPNPHLMVLNQHRYPKAEEIGQALLKKHCASCHGSSAEGGAG